MFAMKKSYFDEREQNTILKLRQVLQDLPMVCNEFFIAIDTYTSPLTRLEYALDLRIFFDFLSKEIDYFVGKNIRTLTYDDINKVETFHIEMFLNYLSLYTFNGVEYKNTIKTKARKLSTLKSYFKFCYEHDYIFRDPAARVKSPKIHEKPIIRFSQDEMTDFLDVVESGDGLSERSRAFHDTLKERDSAIMTLFLGTGIRISELVGLNISDVDFEHNAFKITRKGGNQAILYFNDEVKDALNKYLDKRFANGQESEDEEGVPLFISLKNKRISVRNVQVLVKKYAQIASPLKKITPHKLRTTFGTNLYNETKDIFVVAEVLGHKDVNTTKKHYAAISEEIKKAASTKIHLRNNEENEDNS